MMSSLSRRSLLEGITRMAAFTLAISRWGAIAEAEAMPANRESDSVSLFSGHRSPVLFCGDAQTAYRDPAAVYHNGWFYLFFTFVKQEPDGIRYSRVAWSKSRDLLHWTKVNPFTQRDLSLNYGSPGDVVRYNNQWILCLQTYPRPNGEKYGNKNSRIWAMRSDNLEEWDQPVLMRVRGPRVPVEQMGRMIDPFLFEDKDTPGKWWCIYKQHGLSISLSHDLENWTFAGSIAAGENPCILVDRDEYVLFHSPVGGIGVKRSKNLHDWRDVGLLTLGQKDWPWAQGRLTAGFVLDLRSDPRIGKAIMFFHGSQYPEDVRGGFDNLASIGFAWSDDLNRWSWAAEQGIQSSS